MELKAKRLLPGDDDIDLDEELALWEERDLLLARLLECKTFKDAAIALAVLAADAGRSFPRTVGPDERFAGLAPDLLAVDHARAAPRRLPAGGGAQARPPGRARARRPDQHQRHRRGRGAARRAAPGRRAHVPPPHRRPGREARDRRAVPGRARAVQAGPRRARPADQRRRPHHHLDRWRRRRRHRRGLDAGRSPASTPTTDERADDELRAAVEAILLVAEEPVPAQLLAQLLEVPPTAVEELCAELAAELRGRRAGASSWRRSPAATASTATPSRPPTSSASCSRARPPGCRPPPSRRWRSSPTSSRSAGPSWRPSAASTSTASPARSSSAATSRRSPAIPGPGQAVLYGTTPAFLEKLGLDSLDDLPPLGQFVPGAEVVEQLEQGLRPED